MKMTRILCLLVGILLVPVLAQACIINCSIAISGSDGTNVNVGIDDVKTVFVDDEGVTHFVFNIPATTGGESEITSLVLKAKEDPEVGIEFGVRAGSSDTEYTILSGAVTFAALENAVGYASAGITLTDREAVGATITGLFDGDKVHQAKYNGTPVFASLVNGFGITGGTLTTSEAEPSTGDELISGTLTSIESAFHFILSANDSASGTSTFMVTPIPEPATLVILGLGGLLLRKTK
ncbi:MAG: hypothetical protein LLF92_05435 [Planctomycetaceae bacterium]|nr:hypothetical protein [Planctomycetaceae bacterium]